MRWSVVAVSCSVGALLLASCGSDSSGSGGDSTTPATATTSTAAPAPTSSQAAAAPSSTTTVVLVPDPTVATTTPPDITDSTDDAANSTPTDPTDSTDSTGKVGSITEYAPVASPVVPTSTKPVSTGNRHTDGVYYASVSEGGDPPPDAGSVVFEVVQLFTGPDCLAHFGNEDEDACVNDYGVETDPTEHVEVALDDQFISVVDAATQQSYRISGSELYDLLLGDLPSAGSPPDYLYSGFGFLVTYQGGEITRLEQWWTP